MNRLLNKESHSSKEIGTEAQIKLIIIFLGGSNRLVEVIYILMVDLSLSFLIVMFGGGSLMLTDINWPV